MYGLSKCKGCGKAIEWIEVDGHKIPVESKVPTYEWDKQLGWKRSQAVVNHLSLCTNVEQISPTKEDVRHSAPTPWYQRDDL